MRRGYYEPDSRYDRGLFRSDRRRLFYRPHSYRDTHHHHHHYDHTSYRNDRHHGDFDHRNYRDEHERYNGEYDQHHYDQYNGQPNDQRNHYNANHYEHHPSAPGHQTGYPSTYSKNRHSGHYLGADKKKRQGCLWWFFRGLLALLALSVIAGIIDAIFFSSEDTIGRDPLPEGVVNETSYYTDQLNWIDNERELLKGMEIFYDRTGVQPHLFITDNIEGNPEPSLVDMEEYTNDLYQELFTDEAHLLLVFLEAESGNYMTYYVVGSQAQSVIDAEAGDILLDSIDRYYDEDMTDAEFFSHSFERASDQIMEQTEAGLSSSSVVIAMFLLLLGYGGYRWWKGKKEKEELEKRKMEEILNEPLPTFGTTEAEELSKKYQDTNN
ncbi:hypothetical protein [Halalkalibacterium halodurans]|uniref:hypothetical protein n=1 Tax=Halalkalibacterium halodurans TaxID=86665 RepID=UPI002AAA46AA|nr:hypothetical protein [Halalkalibacterium halodurans]MDY7222011.1 hypothetical protein [Halalkalibacterium halodurans]MDY7241287.1 hypothetical protein [Halalkalibacterium halodurans]